MPLCPRFLCLCLSSIVKLSGASKFFNHLLCFFFTFTSELVIRSFFSIFCLDPFIFICLLRKNYIFYFHSTNYILTEKHHLQNMYVYKFYLNKFAPTLHSQRFFSACKGPEDTFGQRTQSGVAGDLHVFAGAKTSSGRHRRCRWCSTITRESIL